MFSNPRRLSELAGSDEKRLAVLEARKTRSRARSRRTICRACSEDEYSNRDPSDICDQCLIDLWGAQNVLTGAQEKARKDGLIGIGITSTYHWLDYPGLATTYEKVPRDAVFARKPSGDREPLDSGRTLQFLYVEIVKTISQVLPPDPNSRDQAEPLIPGGHPTDWLFARMPSGTVKALRDLWHLFRWHSHESYRQGFNAGHDLLSRLNLGQHTHETFTAAIAEQTTRLQEQMAKAAKGKSNR